MIRFLILILVSWLLMLLPAAMFLHRILQAEHFELLWGSMVLAPVVAWLTWQAISMPLPKVRFVVLQWLAVSYALGIALLLTAPLLWSSLSSTVLSVVTLALWMLTYFYGLYSALVPSVNRINLQSEKLSRRWRIVQISDVHVGSRSAEFLQKVVAQVKLQEPDLVLITGDLVDGSDVSSDDLRALAGLPEATYMVTGNHERYIDMERVLRDVEVHGVKVLRNQAVEHQELRLIGLDDEEPIDQVAQQLDLLNPAPHMFNILLYHKPDGWQQAMAHGVSLMLSGHTHGGQMWPFGYAVKRRHPQYQGLYSQRNQHLYVNQGTGTWGPIFRLGTRGEITVFELGPRDNAD